MGTMENGTGENELDRGGHKEDTRVAWIELREPVE